MGKRFTVSAPTQQQHATQENAPMTTARTAARHRTVQRAGREGHEGRQQAQARAAPAKKTPVQAGPRNQPQAPLPAQHLEKPGNEADMALRPRFEAPDYKGSGKLKGMAALITGGDSGIGRAWRRRGHRLLDEDEDADETRRHVEAEGARCVLVKGDVRKPAFCKKAVDKAVKAFGSTSVNNAAFQLHADHRGHQRRALRPHARTNVYGYFQMARAAVPHLRKGSSIINTGSVTGLEGSAQLLDYSTTKGAIHAFTKALASNLLDKGIRVNAVAPGPVWTPLNPADKPAAKVKDFGKQTDMKRPAQPEELSPAYVFLAAPSCASYITGIVLPVTGSVGAV
jgi:NAD(P)-dependent dehydrogenase (short-subunit alcohol dehydrogenase family)